MSKAILEQYYKAFNEKNFEGMLSLLSNDVVHEINEGETQIGVDAFRTFLKGMDTYYDETAINLVLMTNDDNSRGSAEFRIQGTYKVTCQGLPPARGQQYDLPVGAFFEFKNGKITRVTNYYNLNLWLKLVK